MFFGHLIDLQFSFDPRVVEYLSPSYPIFWLFRKQPLQKIIKIWWEKVNLRCLPCFSERGYIMKAAGDKGRVSLSQLVKNAA
jgi:hypothetical protein